MDIGSLDRDYSAVDDGEWVAKVPRMDNVRFRVRGLTAERVVTERSRRERAVPRSNRDDEGMILPNENVRLFRDLVIDEVLLDWDGFTAGGKPFPFDKETARAWIHDPKKRDFFDGVVWAAQRVDLGKAVVGDALAKNSPKPSRESSPANG